MRAVCQRAAVIFGCQPLSRSNSLSAFFISRVLDFDLFSYNNQSCCFAVGYPHMLMRSDIPMIVPAYAVVFLASRGQWVNVNNSVIEVRQMM